MLVIKCYNQSLQGSSVPSTPISNRPLPPAPASEARDDSKEATDVLKEGRAQCLVAGQWSDVYLVLRAAGSLDMFSGTDVSGPKMDQLGLTLAHCTVSLQSSVGYTEVYHINTTDRYGTLYVCRILYHL